MARINTIINAKKNKNDEFYTRLEDIERELKNYKKHFAGKVVYCNCDDVKSNFAKFFSLKFDDWGLKGLIATSYKENGSSELLVYNGDKNGNNMPDEDEFDHYPLKGNGDFRSDESIELLKQADIVVTNPPFSLFREYVDQLVKYDKKFVILGNQRAAGYNNVFKLIQEDKIWLGVHSNCSMQFRIPESYDAQWEDEDGNKWCTVPGISWFTNLEIPKRKEKLILFKEYSDDEYPKYDEYDAIEVSKCKYIPKDYEGLMGVPITYLCVHNPEQFEIIGQLNNPLLGGKHKYIRVLIKNRHPEK